MVNPSEPRKDGLRCECGKLLLEKDPEMGLGVRCGRDNCRKFHPLEETNQRAVEFTNQQENRREEMGQLSKKTIIKVMPESGVIMWEIEGELLDLNVGDEIQHTLMMSPNYVLGVKEVRTTRKFGYHGLSIVRTVIVDCVSMR